MRSLVRTIERISGISGYVTAWLVAPLIFATVYDVGARYLFNSPTQWAYEVAYMAMGTHALLGMAYTLREGGHIRIDAFSQMFSENTKAWIDLVGYSLFVLPCLLWMTWSLWSYWWHSFVTNELSGQSAWNPIIWPFKLVFFIAFVLLVLQIFAEIFKAILFLTGKRPSYEGNRSAEAH
ncbi:TRAP transporter small permease subunit [Hyphomicrobium sp. CS1BSMeth3]|uniref:TRAP transporter small permease subunit n=1 Tax=Hyphomicrobium sp. CS1BSMeth3 TaxID=1892844 RepID=UPI0009307E29|nr:TRAP transporter small permease subunit [Hyphomicrobium sp. CS1BSMeth3]